MKGQQAAASPDNDYMEMDTERREDNDEDTYENGDTLGIDIGWRSSPEELSPAAGQNKDASNRRGALPTRMNPNAAQPPPPPKQYIPIRRPAPRKKKGAGKGKLLEFFRITTVLLVVLCSALTASLIALSFIYDRLAGMHTDLNEEIKKLIQEKDKLNDEIGTLQNLSETVYHVSSTEYPGCLSRNDLLVVNHHVLQKHMKMNSFFLYHGSISDRSCSNQFSWICSC